MMKSIKTIKHIAILYCCISYLHSNANQYSLKKHVSKGIRPNKTKEFTTRGDTVMDYPFKDTSNKTVRLSDYRGKFVLVDLWYSGCGFCIDANRALRIVHEKLKSQDIIFLSISIDSSREKWIESITQNALPSKLNPWAGQYYPAPGTKILYTGGSGSKNDFVKKYVPENSYPKLIFIDPSGRLISDHPPRPDSSPVDQPEKLVDFILNYLKKSS